MRSVSDSLAGRADILELESLSLSEVKVSIPDTRIGAFCRSNVTTYLAPDVGIAGSTAAAWLAVLDASGQVALLEPWFGNRTKLLVKGPELYLWDSGLCSFLVGIRREAYFLWHRSSRFELADAKWTELPDSGDLAPLRRVAAELPRGRVDGLSIVCRAPHEFPLPPNGCALPLDRQPERWAS